MPIDTAYVTAGPRDPDAPRVLAVVAHPDDDVAFAGLMYKNATHLGGLTDVCVLTNGEGGFKYATLAESIYGLQLTDEDVGRRELAAIVQDGDYDFLVTFFPNEGTHGHHKSAALLALQAVESLPLEERPITLGVRLVRDGDPRAIAAHRSQGTMQLFMGRGSDVENYVLYAHNPASAEAATRARFERLAEPRFVARSYGPSAGAPRP